MDIKVLFIKKGEFNLVIPKFEAKQGFFKQPTLRK